VSNRSKALWSVIAVTCLLLLGATPATAREQNVCVSYDGINYVHLGSAGCSSDSGSASVAVGEDTFAGSLGSGNTAVAVATGGTDGAGAGVDNSTGSANVVIETRPGHFTLYGFGGSDNCTVVVVNGELVDPCGAFD